MLLHLNSSQRDGWIRDLPSVLSAKLYAVGMRIFSTQRVTWAQQTEGQPEPSNCNDADDDDDDDDNGNASNCNDDDDSSLPSAVRLSAIGGSGFTAVSSLSS